MSSSDSKRKVIIIGGGVSGLVAATTLIKSKQFDVRVLEGSTSRIGGRVCSEKFGEYHIERGAQFIHGEQGNSVYKLAYPLGFLNVKSRLIKVNPKLSTLCIAPFEPESLFVTQKGNILDFQIFEKLSEIVEKIIEGPEDESQEFTGESAYGDFAKHTFWKEVTQASEPIHDDKSVCSAILDWIHRYQNNIDGSDNWFQPSCKGQSEYHTCKGNPTCTWIPPARYSTILKLILGQSPEEEIEIPSWVEVNKAVVKIQYDTDKGTALVSCKDGSDYQADHVICTISLGCLKAHHQTLFDPPLEKEKIKTILNLGFGAVDKIHIEFEDKFWPDNFLGYNLLWDDSDEYSFIYDNSLVESLKNIDEKTNLPLWTRGILGFYTIPSHPNALLAWMTGLSAKCMESLEIDEVKNACYSVLKQFLSKSPDIQVPQIINIDRTNWFTNEFTRGSYSFRSIESEKEDVWASKLAEPIFTKERIPLICFAGEATHSHYYSTVHGAHDTGLREATRILNLRY